MTALETQCLQVCFWVPTSIVHSEH